MRGFVALLVAFVLAGAAPALAQDSAETPEELRGMELLVNGDPSDDAEARRLLEIAAAAGRAEAINALANMVGNGLGGPADEVRAIALLTRAGELGSIGANMTLADLYANGRAGFPRDPERAMRHAVTAAESTNNPRAAAYAQWHVGMMYLNGVGAPTDQIRAYQWVARASENGATVGMISRGAMLATGQGVVEDDAAAREWYRRAAEVGDVNSAHALTSLGGMLVRGEGGQVDAARGYAYLLLAQEGGDERATRGLQVVDGLVDQAARAQAPSIMAEWRREHGQPSPEDRRPGRLQ